LLYSESIILYKLFFFFKYDKKRFECKVSKLHNFLYVIKCFFNRLLFDDNDCRNVLKANMGTTNYSPSTSGDNTVEKFFSALEHFFDDMLPYYFYKNTEKDRYIRDKEVSDRIKWR